MVRKTVRRRPATKAARRAATLLGVVASALSIWTIFWPYPYPVVIPLTALMPWAAIALVRRMPSLSLFDTDWRNGSGGVFAAWLAPSLALGWHSQTYQFVYFGALHWTAAGLGALLWGAMALGDTQRRDVRTMIVATGIACVWGLGVATAVDVSLAKSNYFIAAGVVTARDWSSPDRPGRYQNNDPMLEVAMTVEGHTEPFGPFKVNADIYRRHPVGAPICLEVHNGLLGAGNFYVVSCPSRPRSL